MKTASTSARLNNRPISVPPVGKVSTFPLRPIVRAYSTKALVRASAEVSAQVVFRTQPFRVDTIFSGAHGNTTLLNQAPSLNFKLKASGRFEFLKDIQHNFQLFVGKILSLLTDIWKSCNPLQQLAQSKVSISTERQVASVLSSVAEACPTEQIAEEQGTTVRTQRCEARVCSTCITTTSLPSTRNWAIGPVHVHSGVVILFLGMLLLLPSHLAQATIRKETNQYKKLQKLKKANLKHQQQRFRNVLAFDSVNIELPTITDQLLDPNNNEPIADSPIPALENLRDGSVFLHSLTADYGHMNKEWERFLEQSKALDVKDMWNVSELDVDSGVDRRLADEMTSRIRNVAVLLEDEANDNWDDQPFSDDIYTDQHIP